MNVKKTFDLIFKNLDNTIKVKKTYLSEAKARKALEAILAKIPENATSSTKQGWAVVPTGTPHEFVNPHSLQGKYKLPDGTIAKIGNAPGETIGTRIEVGDRVIKHPDDAIGALQYLKANFGDVKKIPAAAGALAAGAALTSGNEAEASPLDKKKAVKAVEEIVSKFREPRGILKRTEQGAEIYMPEHPRGKPLTLSGDNEKQVVNMYGELAGRDVPEKMADVRPDPEAIRERFRRQKAEENLANPEEKTLPGDEQSFTSKALDKLSIPQRILMRKTASALGVKLPKETGSNAEDADVASEAITEQAAENLGIKSPLAKAAMKTVLDVGYDPLNALPGKIFSKGAGKLSKAVEGGSKILTPELRAVLDEARRAIRTKDTMNVFKKKPVSETAAGKLAAAGAEVIKPKGIFGGK